MSTKDPASHRRIRRARGLRRESTSPEQVLWTFLRAHRLGGFHFRRQHPVGKYFVDFACAEIKLAVELDGMTHVGTGEKDDRRTARIEEEGWRVIRFTNDEVMADRILVAEAILEEAQKLTHVREMNLKKNPPPCLPPEYRGEV